MTAPPPGAVSSVGQSRGLIILWSLVQVQHGLPPHFRRCRRHPRGHRIGPGASGVAMAPDRTMVNPGRLRHCAAAWACQLMCPHFARSPWKDITSNLLNATWYERLRRGERAYKLLHPYPGDPGCAERLQPAPGTRQWAPAVRSNRRTSSACPSDATCPPRPGQRGPGQASAARARSKDYDIRRAVWAQQRVYARLAGQATSFE